MTDLAFIAGTHTSGISSYPAYRPAFVSVGHADYCGNGPVLVVVCLPAAAALCRTSAFGYPVNWLHISKPADS